MGNSVVRPLWGYSLSLFSQQRYHGVTDNHQETQTELAEVRVQPSPLLLFSFSTIQQESHSSIAKPAPVVENDTLLEPRVGDAETTAAMTAEIVGPISRTQKAAWIEGVYLCARAGAFIILMNLVLVSIAAGLASRYTENGSYSTTAVMYRGSCGLTKRWNTALHLIINVLSTCILAASNYCMQTLVAPTREEVDAHHAQRKSLDIGSASVKNLFTIGRHRLALWVILMLTATPFHLMYNSMVFESLSTNVFVVVVGPNDLDSSNIWDLTTPALDKCFSSPQSIQLSWHEFASQIAHGNYERLSTEQCAETYMSQTGIRGIVALADNLTVGDGGDASILLTGISNSIIEPGPYLFHGAPLSAAPFVNQTAGLDSNITCQSPNVFSQSLLYIGKKQYGITGCLAIKAPEHCQLLYSPPICIIIMLSGCAKVAAMFLAARIGRGRSPPLLTVGDAVASFLTNPDPTTKGLCWVTAANIRKDQWKYASRIGGLMAIPQNSQDESTTYKRLPKRKFWMRAASGWRWTASLFILRCLSPIITAILLFFISNMAHKLSASIFTDDIKQWFTSDVDVSNYSIIGGRFQWNMLSAVVVANIPQLFITVSYYCYNAVLTSMLAAAEYSSYGVKRKALRVTWPIKDSQQRSTYWLSVPYRYVAPILALYMVLHWLVSQSLFYLMLIEYLPDDQPNPKNMMSSLGYSSTPIFLSILIGAIMILTLFALAFRKFKSTMPLAASSSAAISAACHPPKDEDLDTAALGLVKWGETISPPAWVMERFHGIDNHHGHCSFTSLDTVIPSLTKLYA
ncbi:hypothetical protein N7527_003787 [Penicillium freii]|nr:hypothetical protein N7527_003787 [Penicillium freii]